MFLARILVEGRIIRLRINFGELRADRTLVIRIYAFADIFD